MSIGSTNSSAACFDVEAIAASVSITMDFLRAQRNHDIAKTSINMVREFDKRKGAL